MTQNTALYNQGITAQVNEDITNASNTLGVDKLKVSNDLRWAEAGDAVSGGLTLKSGGSVASDLGKYGLGKDFVSARFDDTLAGKIRKTWGGGAEPEAQGVPNVEAEEAAAPARNPLFAQRSRAPVRAPPSDFDSAPTRSGLVSVRGDDGGGGFIPEDSPINPRTPAPAPAPITSDDTATPDTTQVRANTETTNLTGDTAQETTNSTGTGTASSTATETTNLEGTGNEIVDDYKRAKGLATGAVATGIGKVVGNIQGGLDIYDAFADPSAFKDGYNASSAKGTGWEYAGHILNSVGTVSDMIGIFVPGFEELGAAANLAGSIANTVGDHELAKNKQDTDTTSASDTEGGLKASMRIDPNLQSAGLIASQSNNINKQSTVSAF